ncbi:putative invertase inhibitor [Telopea speciosissima]|uniref:putative invertase inhibitor n=1 Tax=Telopea speciosissima TaxID=54955 RepID=UPI001CC453E0|nr:putative invertase inhibitor [Telopea speciosissima]
MEASNNTSHYHSLLILLLAFIFFLNINYPTTSALELEELTNRVAIDLCNKFSDLIFCLDALGSDPRTETADLYGLAMISFDLARTNFTQASSFAAQLSNQTKDPSLKSCLDLCKVIYDNGNSMLQQARSFAEANVLMSAEANMADVTWAIVPKCMDEFKKRGVDDSPLREKNHFVQTLSALSVRILQALQGKVLLD